MTVAAVGFVGLGNMGSALASNLVQAGHAVVAHDALGPQRVPDGASHVGDVGEVACQADVMVFSLPDGAASEQVAREILAAADRRATHVVDTSTIGVHAARVIAALLADHGIAYVDAPVSGGVAGAHARTLAVMYAGTDDACAHVESVIAGLTDRRHRVGERWAKSVGPEVDEAEEGAATEILRVIARFRLNAKHLDVEFTDGSRWENAFRN